MDSPHTLNRIQGNVLKDQSRYIMYSGGYGCGKTLLGCYWAIVKALRNPGSIGCIMSPTIKMLSDNIINTNLIALLDTMYAQGYKYNKSQTQLQVAFANGSVIRFRAFDDEGKIRGGDYDWIWLDEAIGRDRIYLNENRFAQIRARLRRGTAQQMLLTTNPGPQSHFLYKYFVKSSDPARAVHFGCIRDNKTLGAEYITDMESTYSEAELAGKWFKSFGAVYEQFDHKTHVLDFEPNPDWLYYLAIDFGYKNPFACLLIARDNDDKVYIVDEYYKSQAIIDEHCRYIQDTFLDHYDIAGIVADPAAAGDIAKLRDELNVSISRGKKNVKSGIDAVQRLFKGMTPGGPEIRIHPSCTHLISELENYAWEEPKEGRNEKEVPVKFMDHGLDALRYFALTILVHKHNTNTVSYSNLRS